MQAAILECDALEAFTDLLSEAQPDGQYSAAAALCNLATGAAPTAHQIVGLAPLPALLEMLSAKSW